MYRLTIITINRDNSCGLEKTMRSVLNQSCQEFEYVIIDGGSTDKSVEVIEKYSALFGDHSRWISEPDFSIYNAMNKGISMATGEYVQFLNSGDCLASEDVIERMLVALKQNDYPPMLYGNMLKDKLDGFVKRDKCFAGASITLLGFYYGTLNHSSTYIKRDLFQKYGTYDESLKIVSDWKWFLQTIVLGGERVVYTDIDVTLFDMTGISETNKELDKAERKYVLSEILPHTILSDYEQWAFSIAQMKRLKRHPWAFKIVWFLERCLFKKEKWQNRTKRTIQYG